MSIVFPLYLNPTLKAHSQRSLTMDIIFLSGLKIDTVIGIYQVEKLMTTEFNVFLVNSSETDGVKHPSYVIKQPLH